MCWDRQTKKILLGIIIPLIGVVLMIGCFITIVINPNIVTLVTYFMPGPGAPEIKYGEFPFRLEYELNGQRHIVEDIAICKFDGYGVDTSHGKYRKWKMELASGQERITLLKLGEAEEIYFPIGYAQYYMGDKNIYEKEQYDNTETIIYNTNYAAMVKKSGNITSDSIIEADELLREFKIKIISWEPSAPITNTFK